MEAAQCPSAPLTSIALDSRCRIWKLRGAELSLAPHKMANVALLIAIPLLQACLVALLIRRGTFKSFLFFFIYTVFSVVAGVLKFIVHHDPWTYYYVFWTTEALYAIVGFLAIFEVFQFFFREFYVLPWFRFLIPSVAVLTIGISVFMAVYMPPIQAPLMLSAIFVAEIAVRCLQGGIFVLLVLLAKAYSLLWRRYALAIATGFGLSALANLVTFLLRSESGTKFVAVLQFVPPVAYIIAVVLWLVVFSKPEPRPPLSGVPLPMTPENTLDLFRRIKKQLDEILKRHAHVRNGSAVLVHCSDDSELGPCDGLSQPAIGYSATRHY
jgi:hypothetical protein